MAHRIELAYRPDIRDPKGEATKGSIKSYFGTDVESVRTRQVFLIDADLTVDEVERIRIELTDPVIQESSAGFHPAARFDWAVVVGFRPGVTDNVGRSAKRAIEDVLGRSLGRGNDVYTSVLYLFLGQGLSRDGVRRFAKDLLANELIQTIDVYSSEEWPEKSLPIRVPKITDKAEIMVEEIDLVVSDDDLMRISDEGILSLSLEEMKAIRDYFASEENIDRRANLGLGPKPTDLELEVLAQTWSEHCKHKIFNGIVHYRDEEGREKTIHSLFKTFVRGATEEIAKSVDWLVSVFHDNAGVISYNDRLNLVYKVETHNSPSALDPYGGSITGIVGVNRDPFGTGMGAELLINVWGYCLGSPFHDKPLPKGLLHPRRIRDGVHKGVIDGGNQSGIPYGYGWEFFDERYIGKPLVYCGTVGLMPKEILGKPSHVKRARPGDLIVMTGGRIGKDGIHGATFSSQELHTESPAQAVQIGDPITQKMMTDFLLEARDRGLYSSITDNGAGGLSSSVGEMAGSSGGAEMDLSKAPLKYEGLQPWEILLSEAQERMTLAVPPENIKEFEELARRRDVEVTVLGKFTDSGFFHVRYGDPTVGLISLEFMHEGHPPLVMKAEWTQPIHKEPKIPRKGDLTNELIRLLGRLNVCSKEYKSRQYDHEVKGRSILKPFGGRIADVPANATITLAEYGGTEGIVLSYGFNSHYSDIDTYAMVASVIDEAVRKIVAVGGNPNRIAGLDNFCWPDPVESPKTPDGRYKLAQLVRANQALYDVTVAYGVPCISGKDSMKNDSVRGGVKISIPPSLLFSAVGRIDDVRKAVTLDFKVPGDLIYVIGETKPELGASEYAYMLSEGDSNPAIGNRVPGLSPDTAMKTYRAIHRAIEEELIHSLHTPTLGGLATGLALMSMAGELGAEITLKVPGTSEVPGTWLSDAEILFSESNSRFIAAVPPENAETFESMMAAIPCVRVGNVTQSDRLTIAGQSGASVISTDIHELKRKWKEPLDGI